MNKLYIMIIISTLLLLCGCSTDKTTNGDTFMNISSEEQMVPLGPTMEPTFENILNGTNNLLLSVRDSYNIMTELATKDSAPSEGIEAAESVRKKYNDRLTELENTDLSSYSIEDLEVLSSELSDMITAIREARDLLNGI